MRMRLLVLAGLLILAVPSVPSLAGVPSQITVQGKVTDAAGVPLPSGAKTFVFRIYDAPTLGTRVWPNAPSGEVQSITSSAEGLWAGLLGANNHLSHAVFADTVRWLEINVDGTTLPRVRLVTGPYAYRVATVDGATGGSISGNINLDSSTSSTGNILKGGVPFIHDFGLRNIFVGHNAGNMTMTGSGYNTAIGYDAFRNNTTGNYNTAGGHQALFHNTTGNQNIGIGPDALYANTTGSYNTAVGVIALSENTTGNGNTAVGRSTLSLNTTGISNTACGNDALYSNDGGYENTAIGAQALTSNTAGYDNTANGLATLSGNTTGYNVSL